jgi:hypothetical protein
VASGELKNSDLALPEGSIAKRRGAKRCKGDDDDIDDNEVMKRKEGREGYDGRPDEPQSKLVRKKHVFKLPQHSGNLSSQCITSCPWTTIPHPVASPSVKQ